MICGRENSESSQYEESDSSFSRSPKSFRSRLSWICLRVLALLFGVLVIISVAVAVAFIITQKPVDLSQTDDLQRPVKYSTRNEDHPRRMLLSNYSHPELDIMSLLTNYGTVREDHFTLWLADGRLIMTDENGNFVVANTDDSTSQPTIFLKKDQIKEHHERNGLIFSSDAQYVALLKGLAQVYRHSLKAVYEIARLQRGHLGNYHPVGPRATGKEALQLFEWNPAFGAKDFVFVYENNIYYQADPADIGSALPITHTGSSYKYHGVADWLYEEEIFSSSKAVWWSPSGKFLAYASFDDRNVSRIRVPHYDARNAYPTYEDVPYPKAGAERQPVVLLWIWNKAKNATQMVPPPDELFITSEDSSYYLYSVQWLVAENEGENVESLVAVWANREQNDVYITKCRYQQTCTQHHRVNFKISGRKMWSEPRDFKIDFHSGRGCFVILPREYDDGNIYNHVAHLKLQSGSMSDGAVTAFHGGAYDVKEIVGYDKERDDVFFMSAGGSIGHMHLFRVPHASTAKNIDPQCITCSMNSCPHSKVKFSPNGKQFVLHCHFPYRLSRAFLKKTDDILKDRVLRRGTQRDFPYDIPRISFDRIPIGNGVDAHVEMILPRKFDPNYRYPVLLYTYAAPNTNLNQMETPWELMTFFVDRRQYIVVMIDGRGSAHRGWKVKEQLYMNLGGPEVDDQIEVMRKLLVRYSFLDRSRVAVFGWSYGAFVSSHVVARDVGKTFKCAIAVAPVVDFRFYDSAYTERYMGLPQNNIRGYEKANILSDALVSNFGHVKFMLAHGDADDNVHYQNSALLASALQERGIHFKQLVYTNQDHSIRFVIGHLYMEVDRFLLSDCYNLIKSY